MSANIIFAALFVAGAAGQPSTPHWAECDIPFGQIESRIEACGRIIEDESFDKRTHAEAYVSRGHAYYEAGQSSRALSDFSRAVVLSPEDAYARRRRGELLSIRGYIEEATSELDRAIELDPYSPFALLIRAEHRRHIGDLDGAERDLTAAIALDSSLPDLYAERGSLSLAIEKPEQAVADFARVVELDPDEPLALLDLAASYHALGQRTEALRALKAYLDRVGPDENVTALQKQIASQ